jgi:hypothetical protein
MSLTFLNSSVLCRNAGAKINTSAGARRLPRTFRRSIA